jgi:hypothetical protein
LIGKRIAQYFNLTAIGASVRIHIEVKVCVAARIMEA